jgi:DASH complex subunit DAD2
MQPHIRQPSMAGSASSAGQSPALVARVNEKKAELENLRELRDLSAAVASQMEALEQKLATLSDGTEGIVPGQHFCPLYVDGQTDGQGSDWN